MALPLDDGIEQRIREIEAEYTEFLDDTVSSIFYCYNSSRAVLLIQALLFQKSC